MPSLADRVASGRTPLAKAQVVVLPDFFLDHFVTLDSFDAFQEGTERIHGRGGGNLLTGAQSFRVGGNAANTVYALGRLGVPTTLVTRTDRFGALVLRDAFEGLPLDTSCIQVVERSSATVALELKDANVMLSDPGPLAAFGPADLESIPGAWSKIDQADAVVLTNWSQTLEHGTHLLEGVTARARENGAFTFLDTGDPTHRKDAADLLRPGGPLKEVAAWGMNENELRFFARLAEGDAGDDPTHTPTPSEDAAPMTGAAIIEAARTLRRVYTGRLDVHTGHAVFTFEGDEPVGCGTYIVDPLRLTGSGDAWNAGNLLGELLGVAPLERLCLANAVAALTITAPDGAPPTLDGLVDFLRKRPFEERAGAAEA